ncbi:MAG: FoF1 ATP synthase subunit gamma, partial [Kiritimatiellota bacterium]|nr:FoF1 ATP synthase subunit gamma [Kiritimatiellota bacterium]
MASLLQERTRLRTARSLNSILSAMQVVTVVRLQKAKRRVAQVEAYLSPLRKMLRGRIETDPAVRRKQQLIVLSSNRGLCGSFNSNLLARVEEFSRQHPGLEFIAFGRRGFDYLRRRKFTVSLADEAVVDKVSFEG